ncbi:hypothetical protein BDA96_06G180100 [Sorghum bicolor]|uniref:Uncharacterized protein n=1 Tax=Sorghum bicolor TaxID=4558 RepID=A0A921QRM4_SORBI|nr:hypothetical protein BDA96_06G180100 [Sorghum bicolor]
MTARGALLAARHILGGCRRRGSPTTVAALLPQIRLLHPLSSSGEPNPSNTGKIRWPSRISSLSCSSSLWISVSSGRSDTGAAKAPLPRQIGCPSSRARRLRWHGNS